jgi:hypothetical protein
LKKLSRHFGFDAEQKKGSPCALLIRKRNKGRRSVARYIAGLWRRERKEGDDRACCSRNGMKLNIQVWYRKC